jgi:hypothetical protein
LEYYEKEFNALIRVDDSINYMIQPSVSSSNFQSKEKNSRHRLSKSLSENESFNLAIQNISMTGSANASNELKNREIKRRTTIVSCFQSQNSTHHDRGESSSRAIPLDGHLKRNVGLKRSMTIHSIFTTESELKKHSSLRNLAHVCPYPLEHLFKSDYDYLYSSWDYRIRRRPKNCHEDARSMKNTNLKIFDECCSRSYETRRRNRSENECVLSILSLNVNTLKNKQGKFPPVDDYEYSVRTLFEEPQTDDYVSYVRDLFSEESPTFGCPLLRSAMKLIKELNLPEYFLTNDPPQCFCDLCRSDRPTDLKGIIVVKR